MTVLAPVAAAEGRAVVASTFLMAAGPGLHKGIPAWVEVTSNPYVEESRSFAVKAGVEARTILDFPAGANVRQQRIEGFAATPTRIAVIRRYVSRSPEDGSDRSVSELWVRVGDSWRREGGPGQECAPEKIDTHGDEVAYFGCHRGIAIEDFAGGRREDVVPAGWVNELEVAGRYVAWWAVEVAPEEVTRMEERFTLYDRQLGRVVISLPLKTLMPGRPDTIWSATTNALRFDLQADGVAVVSAETGGSDRSARLVWLSPAEPYPHEIPMVAHGSEVTLHEGLIAVRRQLPKDVVVIDLAGRLVDTVGPFGAITHVLPVAFDGRRIAWSHRQLFLDDFPVTPPQLAAVTVTATGARPAVQLRVSQPGTLSLRVDRCARAGPRCARPRKVASVRRHTGAGPQRIPLPRRAARTIRSGRYRVTIQARNQARRASRQVILTGTPRR